MKVLHILLWPLRSFLQAVALSVSGICLIALKCLGLGNAYISVIFRNILSNIIIWKSLDFDEARQKHCHILGTTGSGKSSVISWFIDQNIRKGQGFLLIEPHGELVRQVLANKRLVLTHRQQAWRKLILLDFDQQPPAMNIFRLPLPNNQKIRQTFIEGLASDLTDALAHNMQPALTEAQYVMLRNLLIAGYYLPNARFDTVIGLLSQQGDLQLQALLPNLPSPPLQQYFATDFMNGNNRRTRDALRMRLNSFIIPRQIWQSLCADRCAVDFAQMLAQGQFVIVRATTSLLGQYEARTIGNIIHNLLNKYAFERLVSGKTIKPFYAYFDEAQHYLNVSARQALTGARKTGLSYTFAHHEFGQEGLSPAMQRSIVNNCHVKIYGNLKWHDLKEAQTILQVGKDRHLDQLRPGQFFVREGTKQSRLIHFPFRFAVKPGGFGRGWFFNAFAPHRKTKKMLKALKSLQQELPDPPYSEGLPANDNISLPHKFSINGDIPTQDWSEYNRP